MTGPMQQEPAYVLHRRAWRETSLMVDIFSLNAGRITAIARGGNSAKSPLKAQLQPFQPLLVDWAGRSDLKTLTQVEVRGGPVLKPALSLYSGLYVNELLQRLLPPADPHARLFASYIDVISELSDAGDVEPVLRRFEQSLAAELGYDFAWDLATDTGLAVEAGEYYCYDPEQGVLAMPSAGVRLQNLSGATLLALASGDLESTECRRVAKRVTRVLVDYLLQGRPLNSRSLFSHHRGDRNEP
ncbi:DNA repair protein RecO [Marinobacter sp. TBZ242]|uniref:DNA repair protein RecO n=1 Tax=Marinobacter azerbaijanicus TaxID=3050455 RepID=A0ABT7I8S6_9GAMM|nr:DNA repair protein RecO [Marinobacter sp. TBZ242]MDL0430547.1 DNA repair protein RecO [Marinobacter sp. TBZ242]